MARIETFDSRNLCSAHGHRDSCLVNAECASNLDERESARQSFDFPPFPSLESWFGDVDACCQFHDGQSGLDAESPQISILYRHGFKELSNGHLEHVGQLAKLTRMRDLLTRFPSTYAWSAGHTNQIAQLPLREAFRASGLAQSRQIEGVTHNDVSVTSDRVGAENLIIRFRGPPTN